MPIQINSRLPSSISISHQFIGFVRYLYFDGLGDAISEKVVRQGINVYTMNGLPAYLVSVAAVESFCNELFLSAVSKLALTGSALDKLSWNEVEKWDLRRKLKLFPSLVFDKSFDTGKVTYQQMELLIGLRNELVHYKMKGDIPKQVITLAQKKVALSAKNSIHNNPGYSSDYPWPEQLNCSEGIRWAHNTACETVIALADMVSEEEKYGSLKIMARLAENFKPITEKDVIEWFQKEGIDPYIET